MAPRPFDACLFDLDGVLGDSMPQHHLAYVQVLEPLGLDVPQHEVFAREGMNAWGVVMDLAREQGIPMTEDQARALGAQKQAAFRAMGSAPLMPGAWDVVGAMRAAGLQLAVVTGTNHDNARFILRDLAARFEAIVAEGDYARHKPDPEPYLVGAAKLGVPPGRCAVVENAPNGVKAAKAAGMACVGLASTLGPQVLAEAGADAVVRSLEAAGVLVLRGLPGKA